MVMNFLAKEISVYLFVNVLVSLSYDRPCIGELQRLAVLCFKTIAEQLTYFRTIVFTLKIPAGGFVYVAQ